MHIYMAMYITSNTHNTQHPAAGCCCAVGAKIGGGKGNRGVEFKVNLQVPFSIRLASANSTLPLLLPAPVFPVNAKEETRSEAAQPGC